MMNNILTVDNLNFSYGKNQILKDISFEIEEGDYVGIVGPNGSGKTTLIKILVGLIDSNRGQVKVHDEAVKGNSIGYVPQSAIERNRIFPATVRESSYWVVIPKERIKILLKGRL